jgi:protein disulfide-isomerase-like protein
MNNSNNSNNICILILLLLVILLRNRRNNSSLELMNNNKKVIFFYAPWCGHCTSFKPTWTKFKKYLDDKNITHDEIDYEQNSSLCDKYNIQGFPTVLVDNSNNNIEEYEGNRSYESLISWVNKH